MGMSDRSSRRHRRATIAAHGTRISATDRRHRRVGHPGRRRQGQGAEGGRRARHRLRRRRARLPDAGPHRRGRRRGLPRPGQPPLHAGGRPARAAGGHRRQDHARLRRRGRRRARCSSPTAASTPSTTPSRPCSTRATRCSLPGAVLDHLPRGHRPRRRRHRSRCSTDETTGFRVTVDQLEAARTPRTKALVFVSPSNPTGAVYPRDEVEAIGRWARRARHLGRSPTRSTSTSPSATTRSRRCRRSCPSWPTRCVDPQRRGQDLRHDRLAGRLDDRPARRDQGRHQPAVALDVERLQRRPARRPRRRGRPARRRRRDARRPSSAGASIAHRHALRHRRRHLHRARGRVLRLSQLHRAAGPADRGPQGRRPPPSWPSCCSTRPRWRSCPARRSARPATPASASPSATTTSARASRRIADLRRGSRADACHHAGMARVLVTEEIAEGGLDRLRAAGHEVDVQLGPVARGAARRDHRRRTPSSSARPPRSPPRSSPPAPTWSSSAGPASASTTSTSRRPPAAA